MSMEDDYKFLLKFVREGRIPLREVPMDFRSKELCEAALNVDSDSIYFIPKNLCDENMCLHAVKNSPAVIAHMDSSLITSKVAIAAVKKVGKLLFAVPEDKRTRKVCLEAVANDGWALSHVPEILRDSDMYLAAVRSGRIRPEDVAWDENLCLEALKSQCQVSFEDFPKEIVNEDFCEKAVRINAKLLEDLPDEFHTPRVYAAAIQTSIGAQMHMNVFILREFLTDYARLVKDARNSEDELPSPR